MLYDTFSKRKRMLRPVDGTVRMYVCGPTVYNYSHLGHARSYVVFDALRRFIEHVGYPVRHVQNFTDIEDSIIRKAGELGIPPAEVADRFIAEYFRDMDALSVKRADIYPRVTEHIQDILDMVISFVEHGCAYAHGRDVYFDAGHCGAKIEEIEEMLVAPLPPDPVRRNPLDFVIWKGTDTGPRWDSPWGKGRPGWHIECTVMATMHLGPVIDIHGGGLDLIFPHHTFESMLAREFYGTEYVRTFLHNGFVFVRGRKMSKSLGNYILMRDLLRTHTPDQVRYFLLRQHYQENLGYTDVDMEASNREYARIVRSLHTLQNGGDLGVGDVEDLRSRFFRHLKDDFDTGGALRTLRDALPGKGVRIRPRARERLLLFAGEVERILGCKLISI